MIENSLFKPDQMGADLMFPQLPKYLSMSDEIIL